MHFLHTPNFSRKTLDLRSFSDPQHILHRKHALFIMDELGRHHSTQCKTFAALGGMDDLDPVDL